MNNDTFELYIKNFDGDRFIIKDLPKQLKSTFGELIDQIY